MRRKDWASFLERPFVQKGPVEEEGTFAAPRVVPLPTIALKALLRSDGGVHPAVLHHAMRRTEAEIVHVIGNIEPAMNHARGNDQHITDLQLDFAEANRHALA